MNPPSPPPHATSLRWIVQPQAQLRAQAWLLQARAAGFQVVLTPWSTWRDDRDRLAQWLRLVRAQRLVAAILVPVADLAALPLTALDAIGPLLLVATPSGRDDLQLWHALRRLWAQTRLAKLRVSTLGIPTCHSAPWQPDVPLVPPPPRPFLPACAHCGARAQCGGPLADQDVAPAPDPVSNQFDLVDGPQEAALATLGGAEPRHFTLVQAMSPLVTDALQRGQLYLDRSDKARLDDFAADLALMLPTDGSTWHLAPEQPFGPEEALLLAHLRALRGVVVDVGAGPIRYVQELQRAQAAGLLRYAAVEPDLAALERTVTALPEALCLQGTGEHLPLADGCADAVLMLRSYNHLRDVPQALREVARVLKPGGVFLACDNVGFGLCRSPEQLARAHAITLEETPYEHYRNADAPEAAVALQAAVPDGFALEAVHAVGPGTSNQWFLRATRR